MPALRRSSPKTSRTTTEGLSQRLTRWLSSAALTAGLVLAPAAEARPSQSNPPTLILEVDDSLESVVAPALTRRLIQLELADLSIPRLGRAKPGSLGVLYFRVTAASKAEVLVLELWDRGVSYGRRRVSARGSSRLTARRLALAAGQLAEGLRLQRRRDAQKRARLERRRREKAANAAPLNLAGELPWTPGLAAGLYLSSDVPLVGPSLGLALALRGGPRFELNLRQYAGFQNSEDTRLQLYELAVAPTYTWQLSGTSLDLGGILSSTIGSSLGDGALGARAPDPLLAVRLGALGRFRLPLGEHTAATLGAELGWSHEAQAPGQNEALIGGGFVGLTLGIELPLARK